MTKEELQSMSELDLLVKMKASQKIMQELNTKFQALIADPQRDVQDCDRELKRRVDLKELPGAQK